MPTSKPRISITLDDEDLAVLDRFAAASRTPRATVIAQMLHSTVPELERAARLMEAANAATPELLRKVNADLAGATDAVMSSLMPSEEAYRLLIREVKHRVTWQPAKGVRKSLPEALGGPANAGGASASGKRRRPGSDPHLLTGGSKS